MKEKILLRFKEFTKIATISILTCSLLIVLYHWVFPNNTHYTYEVYRSRIELHYQGAKDALVTTIDKYIDSIAPNSCVNGLKLMELCDEYNVDVRLAMAQAHLESHFGTLGIAAKTNSIFNVLAFDGRTADDMNKKGHGYSHPDHSIEPYLILLNKRYLVGNKTEKDLLHKFVDIDNKRYASNPNYEEQLLGIYNRMNENTDIVEKLNTFNKYKTILER